MSCLSIDLFTASKAFSNDGMPNGAHQQHSQTLQSVTVVSVLEQEKEKEETGRSRGRDCYENVHLERV